MGIDTAPHRLYYENVDDRLGPAEKRFFGTGFRRSEHTIRRLRVGAGRIDAAAAVRYPADWSTKGEVDQLPHLSTVDVLVLGAQLAELQVAQAYGLDPGRRSSMWLRRVRIQAGRAPLEEGLDDFPVTAVAAGTADDAVIAGFRVSLVDCRVGPLRIRCEIEHPDAPAAGVAATFDNLEEALGDPADRFYGAGFRGYRAGVVQVEVIPGARRATAVAQVTAQDRPAGAGLDGFRQPSISTIDCFTVGLQLGQILLYELDGIDRARSQTLWMRHTWLATAAPQPCAPGPIRVSAALENVRLLERAADDRWRTADIVATMAGVTMRCAVAHRLVEAG